MTNDDATTPAKRAGSNLWRFDGLSFVIVENTLDLADLEPIVASIQPEFADIRIERRVAGTMAGGLTPEAALLAVFAAVAIPFLAEAGKDAYKAFRSGLFGAYTKAKSWANSRGYAPLSIEIRYVAAEGRRAEGDQEPFLYFVFRPGMDADEFERAILSLIGQHGTVSRADPAWFVILEWDASAGHWTEMSRE